jgi:anti-sigma B factor antagonist
VCAVAQASTDEPIRISVAEPAPGTALLRVNGELDMLSSPDLREGIATALNTEPKRLVIDLSGVEFLGTSGIAALVEARSDAYERDVRLSLVCSTPTVRRPLQIAGLLELFDVSDSLDGALADD